MNLSFLEELRDLDPRDPGRWPLTALVGAVAATFLVLTLFLTWFFVWQDVRPQLQQKEAEEQSLRTEFQQKHARAVNLGVYKQQLKDLQRSFGALLRQLPGKTEVPNLLVDISQTALAAGLQQKLFQPEPEQAQDFYAELPIKMELTGSYHQFGAFVSGIAALPRIVTLHDIDIKPAGASGGYDDLTLTLTAKTYRYLDQDEMAAAQKGKNKFAHPPGH
ncbi:MAG TPA: type 4a pilus biogenesis protein PilO [Steroidobacteraceae bacterium]|jgi:type IV pilus assembly protein PilO|nr:type 4a pilus biogenesis protein PilO [Steroidobacteraceae bacterium]